MRAHPFPIAALLCLVAVSAWAQPTATLDPATGARPGHIPGVGVSEPSSSRASNIRASDTRSTIAPTLPAPDVGADATPAEYLRAARAALVAGRSGEAQQALEMAETRALDGVIPVDLASAPSTSALVAHMHDARRALGNRDNSAAIAQIDLALAG